MTDQLDDLFRDLRADTLTTVRPPGATAARRTLRRRRTTRTVGAAACLAVAGVGGVGAHLLAPLTDPDVGTRPDQAAAAVGSAPAARFSGQGAAKSAVVASGVVLAGHYTLALSCVGRGRVTLTVRVGDAEMGQVSARCGSVGEAARSAFTLPRTLTATAELSPEDGAARRSGYAWAMTLADADRNRLTRDAAAAMPPERIGPVVAEWNGPSTGPDTITATLDAGRYYVLYNCVGAGRITVTVRTPEEIELTGHPCDQRLAARGGVFSTATAGAVSIDVAADPDALRQSAWALRVERLP
jgi:hypothetical protein